jgi:hypothetical protein
MPPNEQADIAKYADEIQHFPLRKLYFIVIFILTLLSPIGLSLQTDDATSLPWKITATIQITSITLIFLLLAWLPLFLPWLISLSPRLQTLFSGLRESGLEEIEAGIVRIKLSAGIKETAATYKKSLEEVRKDPAALEKLYKEALSSIDITEALVPEIIVSRIDELASYYDRIRQTLPSGQERMRLFAELSSILWSLTSRVNSTDLDIRERLNSPSGGKRLSAYKYLEYRPHVEYLNLLLSRAVGVLEEPFGQFNALLALRRLVFKIKLNAADKELIVDQLAWCSSIDYIKASDRLTLMESILSLLESKN